MNKKYYLQFVHPVPDTPSRCLDLGSHSDLRPEYGILQTENHHLHFLHFHMRQVASPASEPRWPCVQVALPASFVVDGTCSWGGFACEALVISLLPRQRVVCHLVWGFSIFYLLQKKQQKRSCSCHQLSTFEDHKLNFFRPRQVTLASWEALQVISQMTLGRKFSYFTWSLFHHSKIKFEENKRRSTYKTVKSIFVKCEWNLNCIDDHQTGQRVFSLPLSWYSFFETIGSSWLAIGRSRWRSSVIFFWGGGEKSLDNAHTTWRYWWAWSS